MSRGLVAARVAKIEKNIEEYDLRENGKTRKHSIGPLHHFASGASRNYSKLLSDQLPLNSHSEQDKEHVIQISKSEELEESEKSDELLHVRYLQRIVLMTMIWSMLCDLAKFINALMI